MFVRQPECLLIIPFFVYNGDCSGASSLPHENHLASPHTHNLWGPKGQRQAAKDLSNAGYLVFSVNHRSAPPRQITDQPAHDPAHPENGRPPQQTNDIKQQIMAAKYDMDCNGIVFVIGGSSGGSHAL